MYEHHGCLASTGNEVKRGQYVPEPQGNVLHTRTPTPTPRSFSMTKISDILHLALEPKGHPSADMSVGSDTLKGTSSKRVKLQRDISPNDDLEKLARETQQSASGKESEIGSWQLV